MNGNAQSKELTLMYLKPSLSDPKSCETFLVSLNFLSTY